MYTEKYFYFSSGEGVDDFGEAYCYPQSSFTGLRPHSATKLDLFFKPVDYSPGDVTVHNSVRLTVTTGYMNSVIASILQKINSSSNIISIADFDNGLICNQYIEGCGFFFKDSILYYNKIANATAVNIAPEDSAGLWKRKLTSMTLCNIHSASASVQVYLSNSSDTWYIVKDTVIPVGRTLKLERDELDYDWNTWSLYVKLGGTTPVDVIVR